MTDENRPCHFPDEAALFAACSAHWVAANPPPDLGRRREIEDPDERLRVALTELYAHFRSTESMRANGLRDEAVLPIIVRLLRGYRGSLDAAAAELMRGRRLRGRAAARTRAAVGHALSFGTWQSLARGEGLDDAEAAGLMCALVSAAAETLSVP